MWPLVHEKLDEFLEQGIIVPVEEPIDWVSSLAYSWKANRKLRVCLDPRDVNKAIKRDHYKIPTIEEITHQLAGSKKFTKVMTPHYFDIGKPVTIQVDGYGKRLGAALLQEERPVAFASKALTPTEQRYANIECELLACVFGAEHFHTYVFGQPFTIESDHKPLEQINLKNLADTPAYLQRMLLRLQNYDLKIKYKPGKEMLLTDTLSRYAPQNGAEVALDIAIHHMHITPEKKLEFQETIQDDPLL